MFEDNPAALSQRIEKLERRLEQLRISRRVLLYLLEKSEVDKCELAERLRKEKEDLEQKNKRYARALWHKNSEIVLLASKLKPKAMP